MPIHRHRHRHRPRRTVSCHPFLVLLGFALLFLAPVLDTIGAAQSLPISAQPTASPTPTEVSDPPLQTRSTPTPTPRVTEEPPLPDAPDEIDDVQANPTEVPETVIDDLVPNPEPATLTLTKGVCDDSGFDPYTAIGLDAFQDACFSPDGEFEFIVANGDGFAETATTSLGSVQFTVPTGNVTMSETIPDGFGEPAVFCWSDLFPSPAAEPFIGNGPSWNVAEGEAVECWWFNVSEPEPQGHTIRVIKQVCPEGFAIPDDYWTLATGCADRLDGIGFALTTDGGLVDGVTDASGEIEWTNVDLGGSGQIQLDEAIPEGYGEPVVWCVSFPQEAADAQDFDFFEATAVDGLVTVTPEQTAPHIFSCTYVNVIDGGAPGDLTTGNAQEGQEQLANTVTVVKHRCPMGVVEDAELDDYQEICTEEHDDIAFTLDHSGGSYPGTTADGEVQWTDVPAGDFAIQETVPAGFVDPLAWCGLTPSIQLPTLMPSADGLVAGSFEGGGAEYICYVFNIPDTSPDSRVVVNKRICADDVDLVLTDDNVINDIITACPESGDGIEFTLDHTEGSSTQAIDGDGDTFWDDVPQGPVSITETIPVGYGEPVWYCITNVYDEAGDLQTDVTPELVAAPGGVLSESIDEPYGEIFACWVFNVLVEDEENSVTIRKWICPEGASHEEGQDWYEGNCIQQHNDVLFGVESGFSIFIKETAGGSVQFNGLPAGTAGVQELVPEGFGEPAVFCQVDGVWQQYDAPTGHWEYDFPNDGEPDALTCHVFNIPGEPGSLTLLKWTCPPGYDLNALGADPQADCTEATDGIDFQFGLSGIGEEAVLQTTGDLIPGGVFFDGLDPETYKATELAPDDIGQVFVLECTGHIMGVLQPYPLQMGNVLEVEIDAGEHLTCLWFNVPQTDGGTLRVMKYTCTTETFVSEVDCEIEEDGKTFDLLHWNVGDGVWDVIDTEVADGVGQITWTELDAGDYGLDEHDGEWCHLTTTPVFGPGEFFSVFENEETVVSVYNCDGEPGQPGDTPEKYPDTGVPPGALSDNQFQP